MTKHFDIMRVIEIDAAHRVPEHGSGCRNLHGHRYKIEAWCRGPLATEGEQAGMTIDFKFLKEGMMRFIHEPCDHGMILRYNDPILIKLAPKIAEEASNHLETGAQYYADHTLWSEGLNLYILPYVPTAENLAMHWFTRLEEFVRYRSDLRAWLTKIVVHETPNCKAEYSGVTV